MTSKHVVTISRKWHNPKINCSITSDGIELSLSLKDFSKAINKEITSTLSLDPFIDQLRKDIGSVTWTFGDAAFTKKLKEAYSKQSFYLNDVVEQAVTNVLEGIKEESIKVV